MELGLPQLRPHPVHSGLVHTGPHSHPQQRKPKENMNYSIVAIGSNRQWSSSITHNNQTEVFNGPLNAENTVLILRGLAEAAAGLPKGSKLEIVVPDWQLADAGEQYTAVHRVSPLAFSIMSAERRAAWTEVLKHLDGQRITWTKQEVHGSAYRTLTQEVTK